MHPAPPGDKQKSRPAMDPVFRALADPTRRDIVAMLADRPRAAGEVAQRFDISRPGVARHLRILRESGLVVTRARGRKRINYLNAAPLAGASDWLRQFEPFWKDRLAALKTAIEKETS